MTRTPPKTVSGCLRWQIEHCGKTRYQIAKETGVDQAALHRFIVGKTGLNLDTVDTLADYFGLELRPKAKTGR